MSNQTPIEKMAWEWLRENHPYTHEVHDQVQKLAAFAAHVESQRPGKVLTDDMVRRHRNAYYVKVRALCKEDTAINMAQGYEAALKHIAKNSHGYLAPAQPLDIRRLAELAGEWFDLPVDNGPGSDIDKLEKYLRERLNKLLNP